MATKRIINIKVLLGEPLDGSGRVCIHLFVQDNYGKFTEPCVFHMQDMEDNQGQLVKRLITKPTRGRLACDPKKTVDPVTRNGVTTITMRSDDARAVTCPKCRKSVEYAQMMALLEENVPKEVSEKAKE